MAKNLNKLLEALGADTINLLNDAFTERTLEEWMFSKRQSLGNLAPADLIKNGQAVTIKELCRRLYAIDGDVLKNGASSGRKRKITPKNAK